MNQPRWFEADRRKNMTCVRQKDGLNQQIADRTSLSKGKSQLIVYSCIEVHEYNEE